MPDVDIPLTLRRRHEVRLVSHLRFADYAEPEVDAQVRDVAEAFAQPFAEVLRVRSDASSAVAEVIDARRTDSGWVEIIVVVTYFGAQAAAAAPSLFQVIAPAMEEVVKLLWISTSRTTAYPVVESENVFVPPEESSARAPSANVAPAQESVRGGDPRPPAVITSDGYRNGARWITNILVGLLVIVLVIGNYWMIYGRPSAPPVDARVEQDRTTPRRFGAATRTAADHSNRYGRISTIARRGHAKGRATCASL